MTVKAYFLPETVDEALSILEEYGTDLLVTAGGTLSMMLLNNGHVMPEAVMGLRRTGLSHIVSNGSLQIGAMATMTGILNANVSELLNQAAYNVGGWAVRNMATVGGNLMMPAPAGDFAVALLALDGMVTIASPAGDRVVPLAEFYANEQRVSANELVLGVEVGHASGKVAYMKYARREANAPTIVTVVVNLDMDGEIVSDARIALNGAASTPMRAIEAENILIGSALSPTLISQAADAAREACNPITDAIASEWYRRKMVGVYVKRTLESLA